MVPSPDQTKLGPPPEEVVALEGLSLQKPRALTSGAYNQDVFCVKSRED